MDNNKLKVDVRTSPYGFEGYVSIYHNNSFLYSVYSKVPRKNVLTAWHDAKNIYDELRKQQIGGII